MYFPGSPGPPSMVPPVPLPPGLEADEPKLDGVPDALDHFSQTAHSRNPSEAGFGSTAMSSNTTDSLEPLDPAAPPSMTPGWLLACQQKDQIVNMQMQQMQQMQQMLLHHQLQTQQSQMPPLGGPLGAFQELQGCGAAGCASSGEWVNAVLSTAPYLDTQSTKDALAILDKAVHNLQQIKALDGIIASSYMAGGIFTAMPHLHAAEHMKAQVFEQQQMLLRQLYQLRAAGMSFSTADAQEPALASGVNLQQSSASTQPRGEQSLQSFMQPQQPQEPLILQQRMMMPSLFPEMAGIGREAAGSEQGSDRRSGEHVRGAQTLSSSLQLLADEDPACLFIVRRINKLGFKASKKLKTYFAGCGTVVRVLVAHSTVRPQSHYWDHQNWPRRRPSSLGFVQMATPEGAQRVLALGQAQKVENCVILVQRFERQRTDDGIEEEDEEDATNEEEDVLEDLACKDGSSNRQTLSKKSLRMNADGWKRQQATFSTRSTSVGDEDEAWKRHQQSAMSGMSTMTGSAGGSGSANGSANGSAGSAKGSGSAYADSAFEGSPLEENTSAEPEEGSSEPKDGSADVEEGSAEPEEGSSDLKEGSSEKGSADGGEGSSEPKDSSADAEDQGSA